MIRALGLSSMVLVATALPGCVLDGPVGKEHQNQNAAGGTGGGSAATGGAGTGSTAGSAGAGGGTAGTGGVASPEVVLPINATEGCVVALKVVGPDLFYVQRLPPSTNGTLSFSLRSIPKTPTAGAKPTVLLDAPVPAGWEWLDTGETFALGSDGTDGYFAINYDEPYTAQAIPRKILRVPATGAPTTLVTETSTQRILPNVSVVDGHLYYVLGNSGGGTLKRVPLAGGAAQTVTDVEFVAGGGVAPYAVHGDYAYKCSNVYWPAGVTRVSLTTGTEEELAAYAGNPVMSCYELSSDGKDVYMLGIESKDPQTLKWGLLSASATPSGSAPSGMQLLSQSMDFSGGLRMHGGQLFFLTNGPDTADLVRRDPAQGKDTVLMSQLMGRYQTYASAFDVDSTHAYAAHYCSDLVRTPK